MSERTPLALAPDAVQTILQLEEYIVTKGTNKTWELFLELEVDVSDKEMLRQQREVERDRARALFEERERELRAERIREERAGRARATATRRASDNYFRDSR